MEDNATKSGPPGHPQGLVLASSSRYRRSLLARLGLPFETCSPDIDESAHPNESAETLVRRLGAAKANAVAARYPAHLIIGGDQLALNGDTILGKPGTVERACEQLAACSGAAVTFLTSVCVLNSTSGALAVDVDRTEVVFRILDPAEISAYVAREQPLDCAGSFKAEALGISLFERIDSRDPTALTGLPLITVNRLLIAAGCNPLLQPPLV